MNIIPIFKPSLTLKYKKQLTTKKHVLEKISTLIHDWDSTIKSADILEKLQHRERLGSTAIDKSGIAIPHARIPDLKEPLCVVISLNHSVNFSSDKNQPVNLIFGLLVPKGNHETHLQILSTLCEYLKNKSFSGQLREAKSDQALFSAITEYINSANE